MRVRIQNRTKRPVLLRLNSGRTMRLSPRATSESVRGAEVQGNTTVEKLIRRRVIARLDEPEKKKSRARGSKKKAAAST